MAARSDEARQGARAELCASLRKRRGAAGLSLDDIARTTRIPRPSLERLEAGRFEELPGDVFVRGFIRSYARCVGVDGEAMVQAYSQCGLEPAPVSSELADEVLRQIRAVDRDATVTVVERAAAGAGVAGGVAGEPGAAATEAAEAAGAADAEAAGAADAGAEAADAEAAGAADAGAEAADADAAGAADAQAEVAGAAGAQDEATDIQALADDADADDADAGAEPGAASTQNAPSPQRASSKRRRSRSRGRNRRRKGQRAGKGNQRAATAHGATKQSGTRAATAHGATKQSGKRAATSTRTRAATAHGASKPGGQRAATSAEPAASAQPTRATSAPHARAATSAEGDRRPKRQRTFLPPAIDESRGRGGLTVVVIVLVIVATLTMSYLLRRPSSPAEGFTAIPAPAGVARA